MRKVQCTILSCSLCKVQFYYTAEFSIAVDGNHWET